MVEMLVLEEAVVVIIRDMAGILEEQGVTGQCLLFRQNHLMQVCRVVKAVVVAAAEYPEEEEETPLVVMVVMEFQHCLPLLVLVMVVMELLVLLVGYRWIMPLLSMVEPVELAVTAAEQQDFV
jgi:hypothetical protein